MARGRWHTLLLVLAVITGFIGVNLAAGTWLGGLRIDATAEQRFTLSEATRTVLADLDTPVEAVLFRPADPEGVDPAQLAYVSRAEDLLRSYARRSGGRFTVSVRPVSPFSEAEDQALAAGLQPVSTGAAGAVPQYLGITLTSAVDDMVALPVLDPAVEARLEYEITAGLLRLQQDVAPMVTVLTTLPWLYAPDAANTAMVAASPLTRALSQQFPVTVLGPDFDRIPSETAVLLIAQPPDLTPWQAWLIDQYALRHGRIALFLDPALSSAATAGGRPLPGEAMDQLLAAWGVQVSQVVLADREGALPVQTEIDGRSLIVPQPLYFAIPQARLSAVDPVTASLAAGIHAATAGAVGLTPGSRLRLEPLARTSAGTGTFSADFALSDPGPDLVLADWQSAPGGSQTIAARLAGPLVTAFPEGAPPPPSSVRAPQPEPLAASRQDASLYVFGDADVLFEGLYGGNAGPVADNEALVLNVIDALAGGAALSEVRSRATRPRRLEVVDAVNTRAQTQLLAEQQQLESRVNALTRQIEDGDGANEAFRRELVEARQRLRTLQEAGSAQLSALRTGLLVLSAGLTPVFWLGLGFWVYWARVRRARRTAAP